MEAVEQYGESSCLAASYGILQLSRKRHVWTRGWHRLCSICARVASSGVKHPDLPFSVFPVGIQMHWLLQVRRELGKKKKNKNPLEPEMPATSTWYYTCLFSLKVRQGAVRMRAGFAQVRKSCRFYPGFFSSHSSVQLSEETTKGLHF